MAELEWLTVAEVASELNVTAGRVRQLLGTDPNETAGAYLVGRKFGKAWAISREEVTRVKGIERKAGNPRAVSA